MSTFDVKVSGYVRRNGVRYAPGETIRGLTEREAQNLIKLGVAGTVTQSDASPSSGSAQSPPDPSTPWGIVALSAAEAAEHIAKVDNPKFLNAVEALEELRDKPRATVLREIEARREELEPPAPPTDPGGSAGDGEGGSPSEPPTDPSGDGESGSPPGGDGGE